MGMQGTNVDSASTIEATHRSIAEAGQPSAGYPSAPTLSVVVPVYRAEQTLPELYRQLVAALPQLTPSFEIIFVEDSGGDRSW